MANQLSIRINVEDGIAVVSRSPVAGRLALAAAAVAGSQFLAVTATAQGNGSEVRAPEESNPIFYPESLFVAFVVGVIVGIVAVGVGARLSRRMG